MLQRCVNLLKILSNNRSAFLFGPRGVGKTSLLKSFFESGQSGTIFNLLHSDVYRRYTIDPSQFRHDVLGLLKKESVQTVAVDEVQRIPELLNEVHSLIEEHKHQVRFILTGSSARKLKRGSANLLAGRAITIKLHPLSSPEVKIDLDRALSVGLLPAIYLDKGDVGPLLAAYVDTYVREEILQESIIRQVEPFLRFLDVAAQSNGEPLTFSKIAKASGTSPHTTKSYFQILEDTLLGRMIPPFHTSVRRQIPQSPKFYFFDCGILNQLRGETRSELRESSYRYGKLFETFVFNELLCANDYRGTDFKFSFWRTDRGAEVDVVLSKGYGQPLYGLEIKSTTNPQLSDLKGLLKFQEEYPKAKCIVLARTPLEYDLGDIKVLPWETGISDLFK